MPDRKYEKFWIHKLWMWYIVSLCCIRFYIWNPIHYFVDSFFDEADYRVRRWVGKKWEKQ